MDSGYFKEAAILSANGVGSLEDLDDVQHAVWCAKNKTEVAVALAAALTPSDAAKLEVICGVIARAVAANT